ncbi:MAG: helix-turn-helix transcriptional regulator [Deltaproteobacteria bacterium]|nr:helix-turn-helix transcriptional regulator [Deltaproteobacteria bacterium]
MPIPQAEQHLRAALGARLARLRHARGLTQEQLAERVGSAPQTIRRIERGRTTAPFGRLLDLAEALGVSLRDLFEDEDAPITPPPWNPEEARVIDLYRGTPEADKPLLVGVMERFAARR